MYMSCPSLEGQCYYVLLSMALNHLQNTMGHFGLRLPTHSPHTTEPSNTDQLIPHILRLLFIHISIYPTHLTIISKYSKSSNIFIYIYIYSTKKFWESQPNCQYASGVPMNMPCNYDTLIRLSLQRSIVSRDRQKSTTNIT